MRACWKMGLPVLAAGWLAAMTAAAADVPRPAEHQAFAETVWRFVHDRSPYAYTSTHVPVNVRA